MPRVNTPSVVDLPLSTFPTTAHLTSGVKDTLAGGNRNKTEALGCPVNTVKSTHAYGALIVHLVCWLRSPNGKLTFPPISSAVLVNFEHTASTSSAVRGIPAQFRVSSSKSPA